MVSLVYTVAPIGFDGSLVEVECDMTNGLPALQIVGMGNKAIDEARERVKSAITNSMLTYPKKRLVINLAPAELPKDGSHYDLPMAISILIASKQILPNDIKGSLFAGELALDGSLRPIRGALSITEIAKQKGFTSIYLPQSNANQAALIKGINVFGVSCLKDMFLVIKNELKLQPTAQDSPIDKPSLDELLPTLDMIHGQENAKRALIIAAAGRHNILFTGSPGAGKTMLAQTLNSLLPSLTEEEKIITTKIHSLAGESTDTVLTNRPFRSPHHSASKISLIGGGSRPIPGEISLSHLGVLFLDEIPEYPRASLEALRQPLEDKIITVSRINGHAKYPADFMLVATMNPCPCGYYGDAKKECSCTSTQIINYQRKLSGPLLDRIDLIVHVAPVKHDSLLNISNTNLQHLEALKSIQKAHSSQIDRYRSSHKYNNNISNRDINKFAPLSIDAQNLLAQAADRLSLSARGYFKTIKVARTIADIDGKEIIDTHHIAEALQYRQHNNT